MFLAVISPSVIRGTLTPPPSKSAAHRLLIAAALAGEGRVRGLSLSADMEATLRAVRGLGVSVRLDGDAACFAPAPPSSSPSPLPVDCGESGSTLRFLIPLYAARGIPAVFTGHGRLPERPLGVYADCLPPHGVTLSAASGLPLTVTGRLTGGDFALPGDVSSQFITGLLFALPLCREDSRIRLTTPLESAGYVDMTLQVLRQAGIRVEPLEDGWFIPGSQTYRPLDTAVESDWSQAAFLLAAGALGGEVTLTGLNPASAQGDREALSLFRRFGAAVEEAPGRIVCRKAPLHGIDIDAAQIPDLVPVLAVTAALADGVTHITGAARLRLKESDRLAAVADGIRRLGGRVEEGPDSLTITGVSRLAGGRAEGYNDHRIVMALSMAALGCEAPVTVTDAQSVAKSWPAFFEDYRAIGGTAHVIDHR
ncbi:3-phosphoshikimate 1-carboxyvinyltransferase [Anaeromassilibacillus sp. SJQ-5]